MNSGLLRYPDTAITYETAGIRDIPLIKSLFLCYDHLLHALFSRRLITQNTVIRRIIVGHRSQIVQMQQWPAVQVSTTTAPNKVHSDLFKLEYAQ